MDYFRREINGWYSPRLGMEMPVVQYGHWGHPLLMFPTAQADFLEYERFGLIETIAPFIVAGKVRVFSINSINNQAWMNPWVPPHERGERQAAYSGYVEEELVPYIRDQVKDGGARIGVTGASFGAFHAANAFFRRPDLFDCLIGLSGLYDIAPYADGYSDDNVYFNNPVWYLPNLNDHGKLEQLRHNQIHLVSGQGAWEYPEYSRDLSNILWSKGVPHNLDLWGHDIPHEWWVWHKMLPHYLNEKVGW